MKDKPYDTTSKEQGPYDVAEQVSPRSETRNVHGQVVDPRSESRGTEPRALAQTIYENQSQR